MDGWMDFGGSGVTGLGVGSVWATTASTWFLPWCQESTWKVLPRKVRTSGVEDAGEVERDTSVSRSTSAVHLQIIIITMVVTVAVLAPGS